MVKKTAKQKVYVACVCDRHMYKFDGNKKLMEFLESLHTDDISRTEIYEVSKEISARLEYILDEKEV